MTSPGSATWKDLYNQHRVAGYKNTPLNRKEPTVETENPTLRKRLTPEFRGEGTGGEVERANGEGGIQCAFLGHPAGGGFVSPWENFQFSHNADRYLIFFLFSPFFTRLETQFTGTIRWDIKKTGKSSWEILQILQ